MSNGNVAHDARSAERCVAIADSTHSGKDSKQLVSAANAEGVDDGMETMGDARRASEVAGENASRKQLGRTRRSRARNSSAMLERLAATPGFIEDQPAEQQGLVIARRRTPRMASLNAAAKVNLFFEPSSPLAGRSMFEIQEHSKPKPERRSSDQKCGSDSPTSHENDSVFAHQGEFPEQDGFPHQEISSTSTEPCDLSENGSNGDARQDEEGSEDSEVFLENGERDQECRKRRQLEADSTSERVKKCRKISSVVGLESYSKNGSTEDQEIDPGFEPEMECDTTTDSPPKKMVDACIQVDLPRPSSSQSNVKHVRVLSVPIRGQLVTSSGSFPFTKKHVVTPVTPSRPPPELTISKATNTKRAAGLNAQAMMNAMLASNGPLSKYKGVDNLSDEGVRSKPKSKESKMPLISLKIPKINFAATSTSTFSAGRSRPAGNPVKSTYLKTLNIQLEKLVKDRERNEPRQMKVL